MRINDLRRLTIRQKVRVRFPLSNGMECVVDEHGISRIPKLSKAPDLNIEDELASAAKFVLETVETGKEKAGSVRVRKLSRTDLESMAASAGSSAAPSGHEHEE